ncbi:MAG: glycosyltransferase family 4 protein [Clostridia bacterium]|nr:glycosyltransferase family 4 protein [Clostridia bacterium]
MKKVLFVATITKTINTFLIPYLKMFKEKGYEVHVASNGNEQIEYCDKHFNILFERFPLKLKNIKAYKELKNIIKNNEYEIVHCHTPVAGVLTRLAVRKARKKGTKLIYTAHGFHFYKGAPLLNWIIYFPIEKICARWTDCITTINKEDYEFAKKHLKIKQVEYVHGVGMDTSRFERKLTCEEKLKFRKSLGINEDDIVFTYVAELNKNKNQILLINTIKELKKKKENIKLLLVSEGPLYNYYKEIIEREDLQNNVKLLGKRTDINEILSITDIYLASSIREGLGLNVVEAMYKDLPVLATENRGHKELVENNVNGYLVNDTKDFKEFCNKIEQISKDKKLYNCFSSNSKEKSKKFNLKNSLDKFEIIYQKLINE